jgi:hypothetical protein
MDQVDYLYGEHRQMERLARKLEAAARLPKPPEPFGFLQLRRAFREAVTNHLKRESWAVYPLQGFVSSEICAALAELRPEGGSFSETLAEHERRWTATRIEGDWRAYCEELAAIIASLRRRIAFEERILYPLLEQDEETPVADLRGAAEPPHGSGLVMGRPGPRHAPTGSAPQSAGLPEQGEPGPTTVEALSFTSVGGRRNALRQGPDARDQTPMFRGYGYAVRGTAYRLAPGNAGEAGNPRADDGEEGRAERKLTDPDLL